MGPAFSSPAAPDDLSQAVAPFMQAAASSGSWRNTLQQQTATATPPSSPAPYWDAYGGDAYGDRGRSTASDDLSQALAQFRQPAAGSGSWRASLQPQAAATTSPSSPVPYWDAYADPSRSAAPDDLSQALAQFRQPAAGSASWRDSLQPQAATPLPASTAAASRDAHGATGLIAHQDDRSQVVRQVAPAPSGSQSKKRAYWANLISAEDLGAWGRSIASREKSRREVLSEVEAKYGTPRETSVRWFNVHDSDGLDRRGKALMTRISNGFGQYSNYPLKSDDFRRLSAATKSGLSIHEALTSINRLDIPWQTAHQWLDSTTADGLTERGRAALARAAEREFSAG